MTVSSGIRDTVANLIIFATSDQSQRVRTDHDEFDSQEMDAARSQGKDRSDSVLSPIIVQIKSKNCRS